MLAQAETEHHSFSMPCARCKRWVGGWRHYTVAHGHFLCGDCVGHGAACTIQRAVRELICNPWRWLVSSSDVVEVNVGYEIDFGGLGSGSGGPGWFRCKAPVVDLRWTPFIMVYARLSSRLLKVFGMASVAFWEAMDSAGDTAIMAAALRSALGVLEGYVLARAYHLHFAQMMSRKDIHCKAPK